MSRINPLASSTLHLSSTDMVLKTIIIGDAECGKTCILRRYVDNTFTDNRTMTIGVDFSFKPIRVNGERLVLQIWDTAGQDSWRTLTKKYWEGADIVIIVFDLTRRETFDSVKTWLKESREILHNWKELQFALIGNKCDLQDEREVSSEEVTEFAEREGLYYTETSAKTGANVNQMFAHVAENTVDRIRPTLLRPENSFRLTDVRAEESWYGKMIGFSSNYCSIL